MQMIPQGRAAGAGLTAGKAASGLVMAALAAPLIAAAAIGIPALLTGGVGAIGVAAVVYVIGLPFALLGALALGVPLVLALKGRVGLGWALCVAAGAAAGALSALAWPFVVEPLLRLRSAGGELRLTALCAGCGAWGGYVFWRTAVRQAIGRRP